MKPARRKIYCIFTASFLLGFLYFGPYGTKELSRLLKILKEHRDENNYLKIELQCLSDIANYEHTEKVIDERELKLLIKTVFSYINNPELKVLIR
jgi:hypothetical protein